MKRILALILCFVMLLSVTACGEEETTTPEGVNENASKLSSEVAMKTANFSITYGQLNYMFQMQYNNFLNSYGQQMEQMGLLSGVDFATAMMNYLGLDINKSLKDQKLTDGSDTYYNYFMTFAQAEAKDFLIFSEYAKEKGIVLPEETVKSIDDTIAGYEAEAIKNSVTLSEYVGDSTGITTKEILKSYATMNAITRLAYTDLLETYEITDEEIDAEYNSDMKKYALVSYLAYTIQPDTTNLTEEKVTEHVTALAATSSEAEFKEYVKNFHNTVLHAGKTDVPTFYEDTVEQFFVKYEEGTKHLDWMFGEAKVGETFTVTDETTKAQTVYMLVSTPGEHEYYLKNVRHILFLSSSFDSIDACRKKAEEVLALYEKDPTEEHFAELAKEYTEDTASAEAGGLYENINLHEMVADFEAWCFDDVRKPGDTGIVLSSYGYHVMYFVGNGNHIRVGHDAAKLALTEKIYGDDYKEMETKYAVTSVEEIINQIEA